ncbi:hypothetical protein [Yinghuangia sp. YIM S09857]|uniref:hypothetical protein n=1 Tax=Yinghuangia sp. YIM S09857 TaxID=3436929 RepID=UPI003F52BD87
MDTEARPMSLAVDQLVAASESPDPNKIAAAVNALLIALPRTDRNEAAAAVPRLTELLQYLPLIHHGMLSVIIGACVELGADPTDCGPVILDRARDGLREAVNFPGIWHASGGAAVPVPESVDIPGDIVGQLVGADADERALRSLIAWWQVQQWELATVAVLSHRPLRDSLAERAQFRAEVERVAVVWHTGLPSLRHIVRMLDDEPLVVLHRPSGAAYRMRMGGLGCNRQLLTLLADVLIGAGHVPGAAPDPAAVALARNAPFTPGSVSSVDAYAEFAMSNADGSAVPVDGCPDDIRSVDGIRLLVLDRPRERSSWNPGRLFARVPGDLVLESVLSDEQSLAWFVKATGG